MEPRPGQKQAAETDFLHLASCQLLVASCFLLLLLVACCLGLVPCSGCCLLLLVCAHAIPLCRKGGSAGMRICICIY